VTGLARPPLFDRRVWDAVRALEAAGARVRLLDGCHAMLYPPRRRRGVTLKVSAHRPPEQTLGYLRRQFAEPNGLGEALDG
jgi:hypothetical protein